MSIETNIFKCLLEIQQIYDFYLRVEVTLKTTRDVESMALHGKALNNTINLLIDVGMISKEGDEYVKRTNICSYPLFCEALLDRMKERYKSIFGEIKTYNKHYDEERNQFYIYTNDIPLKYMGFIMIMEQMGEFKRIENKEYILNISRHQNVFGYDDKSNITSPERLGQILKHEAELGEIAEQFAMEYEKDKLCQQGIYKEPFKVSDFDVAAGFDISSYLDNSQKPNKYIEVKSCDNTWKFYMSRNEIEVAKKKRENYFLYLYNRTKKSIVEIQNPYEKIFKEGNEWAFEAESYKITKIQIAPQ